MFNDKNIWAIKIFRKEVILLRNILILLISTITIAPIYAACLIDDMDTACSLATLREPMNTSYSQDSHVPDFSENPNVRLNPRSNKVASQLRDFGQQSTDFSYNSSCQFGVCNQTGAPKLFNQR